MKYCFLNFLLFTLVLLLPWSSAYSSPPEKEACTTCHENTYDKTLQSSNIHPPFLEKKCAFCHIEGISLSQNNDQKPIRRTKVKISWLQKHYEPTKTHYFLIPSAKVDDTLFVQIEGNKGKSKTAALSLPPLQQLPQLVNDEQYPKISDIQFHGVKRAIFYSATISWKTDEPTDAQIHYGVETFNHKTQLNPQLTTHHTVDISPVQPGKTYQYTVISKDIYGNKAISKPSSFSTEKTGLIKPSPENSLSKQPSSKKKIKHQLAAVGDQYFMTITANQPTYMKIGTHQDLRPRITMPATNGDNSPPKKHARIKSTYDTNITTCLDCHKDYQSEYSHPINVLPKPGMIFPNDYSVLDNGRMHCMTCHDPHASNNDDRIRRPTKQELCTGCHKSYN